MKNYTFIYSVENNKSNQKEISVSANNEGEAYGTFINGLVKPATLVISKTTKRRII